MSKLYDFYFGGREVGYFEGGSFPQLAGKYSYMPYRGPGHYQMQMSLDAGGLPRCYYDFEGVRTSFVVQDCPDYGILVLDDFQSSLINDE